MSPFLLTYRFGKRTHDFARYVCIEIKMRTYLTSLSKEKIEYFQWMTKFVCEPRGAAWTHVFTYLGTYLSSIIWNPKQLSVSTHTHYSVAKWMKSEIKGYFAAFLQKNIFGGKACPFPLYVRTSNMTVIIHTHLLYEYLQVSLLPTFFVFSMRSGRVTRADSPTWPFNFSFSIKEYSRGACWARQFYWKSRVVGETSTKYLPT